MPGIPMVAVKTTDQATVAAWRTTVELARDIGNRAVEQAKRIGKNEGLMIRRGLYEQEFVGLAPVDPSDPPEGWKYVRGQFEPRRGRAGDDARAWLASVQPPSVRKVMADHGLPLVTTFEYGFMGVPGLVMHNDTVFALYKGGPESDVGPAWESCRPSEFYAAQEDANAAADAA